MTVEDYKPLYDMLEEFREEEAGLQARIEEHEAQAREAEIHLKAIEDTEPEDRKVFSPRRAEILYKEEIEKIKARKVLHEEQKQRLCSEKAIIERRISRLEEVCRHQRASDRSKHDASLMELENLIGRIESSSAYIDRNPIQARQELAIIAESLRRMLVRMREEA